MMKKIGLLFISFLCYFSVLGQDYNFIPYSVQNGLPQSQVYAALNDSRGFLWLGTQGGGLSRFDGTSFKNYNSSSFPLLDYLQALFEDNQGRIWIGTRRGLVRMEDGHFTEVKNNGAAIEMVESLVQINDTTLWIATKKGILSYHSPSAKIEKVAASGGLAKADIKCFFKDKNQIWIGTDRGLWNWDGKRFQYFGSETRGRGITVLGLAKDNGGLLVLTYEEGLLLLKNKAQKLTGQENFPSIRKGLCLYKEGEELWIGTQENGIVKYHLATLAEESIKESNGLPHNHIRMIIKDPWNAIWVATSGGGVGKYIGQNFVHYNRKSGLPGDRIYALHKNHTGDIIWSASNKGLGLIDSTGIHTLKIDEGYITFKCKSILEDSQNRLWVGTEGKGLLVFDTLGFKVITEEDGLGSNSIKALVEDDEGVIWAGTHTGGISKIMSLDSNGTTVQTMGLNQGLPSGYITTLKKDFRNRIWFTSRKGWIGYFEKGKLKKTFGTKEGLPDGSIRSIEIDALDHVWVGTAGFGVLRASLRADTIHFEPIENLSSRNVYLLALDARNHLWVGNELGVDRVSLNANYRPLSVTHYGKQEGFLGIETCQNAVLTEEDGSVWFGTMNGLMKYLPGETEQEDFAPKIHFEDIALFYESLKNTDYKNYLIPGKGLKPGLELEHSARNLSFQFNAVDLSSPKDILYTWRMKGLDEEWSPPTAQSAIQYSNLSPGAYTFEVKAMGDDGKESKILTAPFKIKTPFWEEAWFRWAIGIILLAGIFGFIKMQVNRIKQREGARRKQLELDNKVLQLEQKALQLQMNPHFLFNALNSIQALVATKDFEGARQQIQKFAQLMRSILTNSKNTRITLEQEVKTLRTYLEIEQFCQRVPFDFAIHLPEGIDLEEIEMPPMLLQPFVENSVIHGISHLKEKGRIDIRFSLDETLLTIEIEDNGVGRKKAAELRQSNSPGHQSIAMEVTQERLESLFVPPSKKAVEIIDLKDENEKPLGTKVVVNIIVENDW